MKKVFFTVFSSIELIILGFLSLFFIILIIDKNISTQNVAFILKIIIAFIFNTTLLYFLK